MNIQESVKSQMIVAMKQGNVVRKDNLKYLMGLFQNKSKNANKTVEDAEAIALIKNVMKGTQETQKLIAETSDEYQKNLDFLLLCDYLLPKQASEEEIRNFLHSIDINAHGNAIVGVVIKHFNGNANGATVKKIVEEIKNQ